MYIDKTAFVGSTPLVSNNNNTNTKSNKTETGEDFQSVLQRELEKNSQGINFSKHAIKRINERQIEIEPQMLEQMSNAVEHAEEKGIKDALILGSQAAFIVNVPSKTVITTMNNQEMRENIITNIDGTVLL